MNAAIPYSIPKEPGSGRAMVLAALVHALLLAFLWIGVRWQNETPIAVEAEVWSPQTREAASQQREEPEPLTKTEPPAAVRPTLQPAEKIEAPERPDIALEQQRKVKERKALQEQAQQDKLDKAEQKRIDDAKLEKKKHEQVLQEKAALKKSELDKKRRLGESEKKNLDKMHNDEMRRLSTITSGSGGSGDAPKSQGSRADPSYVQKVGARIKSNTIFNVGDDIEGNPAVEYAVDLLPDGSVRSIRKQKSSGIPGFDEAVHRAIERSAPFPADKSGLVPSGFTLSHKPKN